MENPKRFLNHLPHYSFLRDLCMPVMRELLCIIILLNPLNKLANQVEASSCVSPSQASGRGLALINFIHICQVWKCRVDPISRKRKTQGSKVHRTSIAFSPLGFYLHFGLYPLEMVTLHALHESRDLAFLLQHSQQLKQCLAHGRH